MINSLKYSVQFPSNSVALQQDLVFQPGLTAITGENGSGKTFGSIEMFRYMLFGKKALRGPAGDYKTLDAEMLTDIGGKPFTIIRNRKVEQLKSGDEVLAVGADAVNKRLLEELGFSLDVFDLACAALQKQSDRLSQMAPASRKKLIDEIVGLTANEAVEKDCKDEAKLSEREADALRSMLVEPVKPDMPFGYRPAQELAAELTSHMADIARRDQLEREARMPALPAAPAVERPDEATIAEMQTHQSLRLALDVVLQSAMHELHRLTPPEYTAEQLDNAEAWLAYHLAVEARGPQPLYTSEDIAAWNETYAEIAALLRMEEVEITCPDCNSQFCPAATLPDTPPVSREDIAADKQRMAKWDTPAPVTPSGDDLSKGLGLVDINRHRNRLGNAERIEELNVILEQKPMVDTSQQLLELTSARAQWASYDTALAKAEIHILAAQAAQDQLNDLPILLDMTNVMNQQLVEAKVYENALAAYEATSKVYAQTSDKIAAASSRGTEFRKGAKALAETRKTLKGFLAPSLSRVASSLISDMTSGKLHSMIVDDDMNITVNGQDIATLNGAGSTAANLALRIGLGQVLVREKFAVFIADEADADMREGNAQATMACLASLIGNLKQIFVITHKDVNFADQVIEMT